jgi:hypothetical protein
MSNDPVLGDQSRARFRGAFSGASAVLAVERSEESHKRKQVRAQ